TFRLTSASAVFCMIVGIRPTACREWCSSDLSGIFQERKELKNMKRQSPPRLLAVIIAALCISLLAISAFAQTQTGNIFGKVQGKDGSVLPGVTVTLTGVGAAQTSVTDAQGNFRFINLSPGTYALKAELAGLGSSTRNGIDVNLGRNADVTLTLNPAVAESITVTAGAPLLDV